MYMSNAHKAKSLGGESVKTFNRSSGNVGEAIAVNHLEGEGFKIEKTNFKAKMGEVDIIASRKGRLHFIEVKYRQTNKFGLGREAVTATKQRTIRNVAKLYLVQNGLYNKVFVSFDVIEIMGSFQDYKLEHLVGCF